MTKSHKYLTTKGYCKWCFFLHSDHPSSIHCRKMMDRALSRIRKGDSCWHCGHSKTEHVGKLYSKIEGKQVLQRNTLCSHLKNNRRGDSNFNHDDYCECEGYL